MRFSFLLRLHVPPDSIFEEILHMQRISVHHKVRILYIKDTTGACPLVGIGTPPLLSRKRVYPSLRNQRGGGALACGLGVGPNANDWRKGLALCLLCGFREQM
jgi:hypothetical protein